MRLSAAELAESPQRWWVLVVLCLSLVLVVAANNSLNIALPDLQASLHATESQLEWIVDTYSLVFAGLLFPAGSLADRFGRRKTMQFGLTIFGSASLIAVFANQPWQLIALRGMMGAGGAFIMPSTLSILTDVFRGPERGKAIGIWSGFAGAGGAIGLIASGVLLSRYWWGSIFLVNVPIVVLAICLGIALVPHSRGGSDAPLDPLGAILALVGFASLVFGIIEGPERGWSSPVIVAVLVGGAAILAGFIRWELRVQHPMLDPHLFRERRFSVGTGTIFVGFFALYGLAFVLPQYFQSSLGYSALITGAALLPRTFAQISSAPNSARTVRRFGPRAVVVTGLLVSACGLAILSQSTAASSYGILCIGLVLLGLGAGQTNAPSTTMIMNSVREAKGGVGSAVNDTTRELGGALGIAVLGSVLSSTYRASIKDHLSALPPTVRHQASSGFAATTRAANHLGGPQGRALSDAARGALASGFSAAMVVASVVLVVLALGVLVFQHPARYFSEANPTESQMGAAVPHESDVSDPVSG